MIKEITDILKNQDIQIDSAQSNLINNISKDYDTKGFYVWGDVGRGKTLITRLIYNSIKKTKKSFHYIDFMQNIHDELSSLSNKNNPLDLIAKSLSQKYKFIFIDEFQVEDITDAMIIGNLLNQLTKLNVILYLTSNAHPEDLYQNGLQRQMFIKNMSILQESLNVYKLDGEMDYRARNIINSNAKFPDKKIDDEDIILLLKENFAYSNKKEYKFRVNSKYFSCKAFSNEFLWLSFTDFFKEPNGTRDYEEMSKNKEWIFISNFKNCDDEASDIIRRFISFIDICYKDKTKVKLFEDESMLENIYTGEKLRFLWDRCYSRLLEMQKSDYLI